MKVLLISFSTLPTMQNYLYNSADELTKRGIEVWTAGSANLRVSHQLSDRNVVVGTPLTPRPSIESLWASKGALDTVVSLIDRVQPDVIHFVNKHVWNFVLILRLRARRGSRAKFIHTFHDPIGHEGDSVQRGVIAYHKVVQRTLGAVIVHSNVAKSQTDSVLRPKCLVRHVPLGEKKWNDRTTVEASNAKRVLVFGRLNNYKGCEMYPAIFGEIYKLDPEVEVTIAGQPSQDLPDGLIDEIAACPNVKLDGRYIEEADLEGYFRDSALVLTPYTSMTQSGVVLDAYRNSRAVLPFEIPGIGEFLPAGARTVQAFDIGEYANTVVDLVGDPDACKQAGLRAWEFGRSRFAPASMAEGFAQTYRDVLGLSNSVGPLGAGKG